MWKKIFSAPEIVAGISRRGVFWRGLLILWIGILIALKPLLATFTLAILYGWGLVAGGIWTILSSFYQPTRRWLWMLYGILLLIGGLLLLTSPGAELIALAWSAAALLLTWGVIGISFCLAVGNSSMQNLVCFISSICSILMGVLLFVFPISGMTELLWILGFFLAGEGIVLMIVSFRMPKQSKIPVENESDQLAGLAEAGSSADGADERIVICCAKEHSIGK